MCGIVGLWAPGRRPAMGETLGLLRHRGPDDEGFYADEDVYLGARRLSIIDVAGGHQPLADAHERVWVVQNGEIYNYRALRTELESRGHVFRTRSDTEVIAAAYLAWGPACVQRLRGIFAFAVWDVTRRRLFVARDRFGVKPLYYVELPGGRLAFASEIRPLLGLLPDGPRADLGGLAALFTFGFIPTPCTAFAGVCKLPAAHTLTVEEGRARLERYWDIPAPMTGEWTNGRPTADMVDGFFQHLQRAVAEQRMSEVPLGALISGGLDSASIAALLQAEAADRLQTFNIGFEQAGYDETRYAEQAARHIGTRHRQLTCREVDFERYPDVLQHLEEPQCSATALPIFALYEACRLAGLTVILTGEGADELLGGYHWYRGDQTAQRLLGLPRSVRAGLAASRLPMSPPARAVLRAGDRDVAARYARWQGPGADGLLAPDLRRQPEAVGSLRAAYGAPGEGRDSFRQLQYLEMRTRLVDFINFEVDRMSMAHSIEARVPFLDHELWEYTARLPSRVLLSGRPKDLLRRAMRPYLPAITLARSKQGLAAPYAAWLRRPRLAEWAEAALAPAALGQAGYFEPAAVRRLRAEHQAGRRDHSRRLMGVLSTQLWHDLFGVTR